MEVFGSTRSYLGRDHALITTDTHVVSPLVGWSNAEGIIHISPHMGARFLQYTAILARGAASAVPDLGVQRFIFVVEGGIRLVSDEGQQDRAIELNPGGYAFFPAGQFHRIHADGAARLLVIEKRADCIAGHGKPCMIVGDAASVLQQPFMGDEDAQLQTLMPATPEYDMAVNIFTYQPGATLPQVEMHVMEHGLLMLRGMGVYRLSDRYYPVTEGDIIWMASYCPQWFVAMGKQPASYIYFKDIHRDANCL